MKNIAFILDETQKRLYRSGVPEHRADAEWLIEHVSGIQRLELPLFYKKELDAQSSANLERLVALREKRIPLQHLLGFVSFLGHKIRVSPDAFIPRPETERLAEVAIQWMRENGRTLRVLELGTGTACLAIALAKAISNLTIIALEICPKALALAAHNVRFHNLSERIRLLKSDGFASLPQGDLFDLILSNPPYIPTEDCQTLQTEVRDHEPHIALDGGKDGLDFYRRIAQNGRSCLHKEGVACVEFGDEQKEKIQRIFDESKWICLACHSDFANRPRVLLHKRH